MSEYAEYVKEEFADPLVGRTIVAVREMSKEEVDQFCWYQGMDVPIVLFLDDGSFVIPTRDPECNGPGYLLIEPGNAK